MKESPGSRRPGALSRMLLSMLLAAGLLLSAGAPAAADVSASAMVQAADRLKALGIIQGRLRPDGTVDLGLHDTITRAEVMAIMVRAFGREAEATRSVGAATFRDTGTHWASGYIAIAQEMARGHGFTLGRTPTAFDPDAKVTATEALAFAMKFLGVKPKAGLNWPMDYLQGARDAGLISAEEQAVVLSSADGGADRGLVFYLADRTFYGYKLAEGKTVYTQYHPATLTLGSYPAVTEADAVTLTGTVTDAKALTVAGTPTLFTAGGSFTAVVPVQLGLNTIELVAIEFGGGTVTKTATITRKAGAAAQVEAHLGSPGVPAGQSTALTVTVKDQYGNKLPGAQYTVAASALGAFNPATGTFTAATTVATGNITVTSGAVSTIVHVDVVPGPLAAVDPAKVALQAGKTVQLVARDQYGNQLTTGIMWTLGAAGAAVSPQGLFSGTSDGTYTVTAAVGGKIATTKVSVDTVKPVLASISGQSDAVGTSVHLSPVATDNSGGPLTFKADGLPPGLSLDAATGSITGVLPLNPGSTVITVTVTDAAGNSASQPFSWSWYVNSYYPPKPPSR